MATRRRRSLAARRLAASRYQALRALGATGVEAGKGSKGCNVFRAAVERLGGRPDAFGDLAQRGAGRPGRPRDPNSRRSRRAATLAA